MWILVSGSESPTLPGWSFGVVEVRMRNMVLGALLAAVQFVSGFPQSRGTHVLEVAQEFEDWLAR